MTRTLPMFCLSPMKIPQTLSRPRRTFRALGMAFALFGLAASAFAQTGRYRGMGGTSLADIMAGTDHAIVNPAGLSLVDRMEIQAGATASPRDLYRSDHLAFTGLFREQVADRKVTLEDYLESDYEFRAEPEMISNWAYGFAYGNETRTSQLNTLQGNGPYHDRSTSLRISAATRFPIAERLTSRPELYGGFRVRYNDRDRTHANLSQRANADVWNLDVAGFYRATERLTFGGLLRSVLSSAQRNTAGAREESASVDLGGSYILGERRDTTVNVDFRNVFNADRTIPSEFRIGVERRFLDNDFALRVGSWDGVLTLGFGIKFFEDFRMDYSYSNFLEAKEHHISFQLPLHFQ